MLDKINKRQNNFIKKPKIGHKYMQKKHKETFGEFMFSGLNDVGSFFSEMPKKYLSILGDNVPGLSAKMSKVLDNAIENSDSNFEKAVLYYAKGVKTITDNYTIKKFETIVEKCIKNKDVNLVTIKECIGSFKALSDPTLSIDIGDNTYNIDFEAKSIKRDKSNDLSNIININLENKSKKLFNKLGLEHKKIPTLKHNQNLPDNVDGMYRHNDLSLKKNPRVSDKKAEAVAMHEIYHHTQENKGLELKKEEATANAIEKAYLDENQHSSNDVDFDLIYAYTIRQFYEHDELEQLVRTLGGDGSSAKMIYRNAMSTIGLSQNTN